METIERGPRFAATMASSAAPSSVMTRSASWRAPRSWAENDHDSDVGSSAIRASSRLIPNSSVGSAAIAAGQRNSTAEVCPAAPAPPGEGCLLLASGAV